MTRSREIANGTNIRKNINAIIIVIAALIILGTVSASAAAQPNLFDTTGSIYVKYKTNRYMRVAVGSDVSVRNDGSEFIPLNTPLRVTPIEGTDWAYTSYNGVAGYVKHLNYTVVTADKLNRVERGEVYLMKAAPLMSDTSNDADVLERIPANTLLVLVKSAGDMYEVLYVKDNLVGYVSADSVMIKPETRVLYYLQLVKSTHQLSVIQLAADGSKTKEIVRKITSSIGKSSTPTIPGKYTLTIRERWHYFSPSYAPFAIKYAGGKYTHGPLYKMRDEDALGSLKGNVFGQNATGGCLRMSYDDALWLYYNCAEGTVLEVLSSPR